VLGTIEGKGAVLGRDGALGVARRRGRRHDAAGRGGPDSGGDVGRGVTRFDGVLLSIRGVVLLMFQELTEFRIFFRKNVRGERLTCIR